jgi:hypothetical protein
MSRDAEFQCRCGEVIGRLANPSPEAVNRMVCYCDDCQAFLHYLGRADLLDAHGGTDIVQIAPAALSIARGHQRIVGLRLAPKEPLPVVCELLQHTAGQHAPSVNPVHRDPRSGV